MEIVYSQRNSHTHCQAARANAQTQAWQRVCLPNRTTKTIYKQVTEKKYDCPTMAIRNAGEIADMKVITLNKSTAKLKGKCLEIPHYA